MPATLTLGPQAQAMQDTVILSFLFLEKSRRLTKEGDIADLSGESLMGIE